MSGPPVALVTGATGFVGSNLARHLVAGGWSVRAIVRPPFTRVAAGVVALGVPTTPNALMRTVADAAPTVCFHLATRFQVRHEPADVAGLIDANVTFGAQLAEAVARTTRCPFVNVGSAWQRFEGRDASPTSLYAATKQAFEDILAFYGQVEDLPVATLQLFDTYGPDDPRPKLLPSLLDAAATGRELEMSDGEQLIDLLHVDDAVRALVQMAGLLAGAEVHDAVYAARSNAPVSVRQLVALVEDTMGRELRVRWGARPYRPREMFAPWPAPPPPPGWMPTISLADGLKTLLRRR